MDNRRRRSRSLTFAKRSLVERTGARALVAARRQQADDGRAFYVVAVGIALLAMAFATMAGRGLHP